MDTARAGATPPDVDGLLIDIDGVLTVDGQPLPGTVDAFRRLRDAGLPLALATNTTSRSRASLAASLSDAGFAVQPADIVTAPALTAAYLREHHAGARCVVLTSGDVSADLEDITVVDAADESVDVVVLGGAGAEFTYAALDRLFHHLQAGAALVAMHRNLYWRTGEGLSLDAGAFLLGLEHAAEVTAAVLGKPAPEFFRTATAALGVAPPRTLMVGDDLEADVLGAQHVGLTGVLVRTGKYRADVEDAHEESPDHVLDSFSDLPGLLGL
ncbi:MAG: hypothetical protein QOC80_1531 [Frankiaceae bacterium]|nr:hypothetical protein [Frankiaceae bacterium]